MPIRKRLSRRAFLRSSALTALGLAIAGCAQPTPQVIEKEVPVEKVVKETVVVEKQVPVEKVVKETVVVEKEKVVEKEVIVHPFRFTYGGEPPTLDKPTSGNSDVSILSQQLFTNLVRHGPDGKIVGDFAETWTISPDGKLYTFKLRKGVKWSDNSREIVAEDVKYSWDRYFWPETGSPFPGWGLEDVVGYAEARAGKEGEFVGLSGAKVLDDYTFEVTLAQPSGIFFELISYPTLAIAQKENVDRGKEGEPWWMKPVCSGPFVLESWTMGQELVLVPNPNFHGAKSYISKLQWKVIPDANVRTLTYEAGELDMIVASTADIRAATEEGRFPGELVEDGVNNLQMLAFKVSKPPTDDVHVRRALTLAIDRELLNQSVLKGVYEAAEGYQPKSAWWYNPAADYLTYNPQRAMEEAKKSKYGEPASWPKITFTVGAATDTGTRMLVAIADMWKKALGIEADLKQVENLAEATQRREFNGLFAPTGNGYNDPHYIMDSCAITSGWRNAPVTGWEKEGGGYEGAYSNPELDALIAAALKEPDAAKRLKMYQEAEQMWINDAVFIPLYIYHNFFLVKPYVKGLYFPPVWELHFETVTIEK